MSSKKNRCTSDRVAAAYKTKPLDQMATCKVEDKEIEQEGWFTRLLLFILNILAPGDKNDS